MRQSLVGWGAALLGVGVMVAACGDEVSFPGSSSNSAATTSNGGSGGGGGTGGGEGGNGGDGGGIECCTPAECAAMGQVCNTVTCMCEEGIPAGCMAVDEPCSVGEPQTGFVCWDWDGDGDGFCREACDPDVGCPGDVACIDPEDSGDAHCAVSDCATNSWFDTSSCDDDGKCIPVEADLWICLDSGAAVAGEPCDVASDCDQSSFCGQNGFCFEPDCAALTSNPGCGANETCEGFEIDGTVIDMGLCFEGCADPYETSTCTGMEWCFPDVEDASTGFCTPFGTAQEGDPCDGGSTVALTCAEETFCSEGECVLLCDPNALPPDPGNNCSNAQLCAAGQGAEVGVCIDTCSFHDPVQACPDNSEDCLPLEIAQTTEDVCVGGITTLAPFADCTANGIPANELCGPNSICLEVDQQGTTLCIDICMTSEAPFGTTGHPDCREAATTCNNVLGSPEIGLCVPN